MDKSVFRLIALIFICYLGSISTFQGQSKIDSLLYDESRYSEQDTVKVNKLLGVLSAMRSIKHPQRTTKLAEAQSLAETLSYTAGIARTQFEYMRYYIELQKYDSVFHYARKALETAEALEETELLRDISHNYAAILRIRNRNDEAENFFLKALDLSKQLDDPYGVGMAYSNLSVLYWQMNRFDRAKEMLIACEPYLDKANNPLLSTNYYLNRGILYKSLRDSAETVRSFRKSKEIARKNNLPDKEFAASINLTNYLTFNLKNPDLDQGLKEALETLELAQKLGNKRGQIAVYSTLANIYGKRKERNMAITYYDKAIEAAEELGLPSRMMTSLRNKALILRDLSQYDRSIEAAKRLSEVAKKYKNLYYDMQATNIIASNSGRKGDYKNAYEYERKARILVDSLRDERNARQIGRLESAVELANKEKENTLLVANNQLEAQKREKATLQRNLLTGVVLLGLISAVVIFYSQKARQKAIRKLVDYEKGLNKMRTEVFMSIAHEIRTPLTLIYGPTLELQRNKENDTGRTQTILKTITNNCEKIIQRIEEIFDLSKLENESITVDESVVLLKPFVDKLCQPHEISAELGELTFQVDFELEEDIRLSLDKIKVAKIVENLLNNAVKYTPANGNIRLKVYEDAQEGTLSFSVEDTGAGIKSQDLPRVFERYFRSEEAARIGGTGIGLALAKELAQLMGGDITVESHVGKGSKFVFSIPFKLAPSNTEIPETNSSTLQMLDDHSSPELTELPQTSGARVLVVEDNRDMSKYLKDLLATSYQVTTAFDGLEAWEILKGSNQSFDLIISDVMMPRMDGFEFLERLKADDNLCSVPVVMLTAKTAQEDRIEALRVGVDDYIHKPFDARELLYRVVNLIGNKKMRDTDENKEPSGDANGISTFDMEWLANIESIVEREIENTEFSVSDLASQMASSIRQVQRKLSSLTGLTPVQYIRQVKLSMARELLESGRYQTVSEVSYKVGFDTPYYFSTLYFKQYGKKPTEYFKLRNTA